MHDLSWCNRWTLQDSSWPDVCAASFSRRALGAGEGPRLPRRRRAHSRGVRSPRPLHRRRPVRPGRRRQRNPPPSGRRRHQLRRHPQHQFHQRLLRRMQVLRLQRRPARPDRLFPHPRRSRREVPRSRIVGRHRSLHSGRTAAQSAAVLLSRRPARREVGHAQHARPRLLAHGDGVRHRTHRHDHPRLPADAERERPRHPARHRRRNSRRRRAPRALAQQAHHRAVVRDHRDRAPVRHPQHLDHDVRPSRDARALGQPDAAAAQHSVAHRRLHRVRARWASSTTTPCCSSRGSPVPAERWKST